MLLKMLLDLPGDVRESVALIRILLATPCLRLYSDHEGLTQIGADIPGTCTPVDVEEVNATGLLGQLHTTEPIPGCIEIRTWSGSPQERQAWQNRIRHAGTSGRALLKARADLKLLDWQRKQAIAALDEQVRELAAHGTPITAIADIAGVARRKIYEILAEAPASTDASTSAPPEAAEPASLFEATQPSPPPTSTTDQRTLTPPPGPPSTVAMPREHSAPCVVCGKPATDLVEGSPVHLGECRRQLLEGFARTPLQPTPAQPGPSSAQPAAGVPAPAPVPAAGDTPTPSSSSATETSAGARTDRWAAPAAVLLAETVLLPGGRAHAWEATHLGELALLADTLRLGHGGGERLPEPGQLWLTDDAIARLGLPVAIDLPEEILDRAQWLKAKTAAFEALSQVPAVADALAAGWQLSNRGRLDAWVSIWHPQLLKRGARLVFIPWNRVVGVELTHEIRDVDDEVEILALDPSELVDRLAQFADAVGIPYRLSPATTGLDLIDHTRPPRGPDEELGANSRSRVAVKRWTKPELPAFLTSDREDTFQYRSLEQDYSWWRPWDSLLENEKSKQFAIAWDRGASYLAPWTSIDLGVEGLVHRTGDEAAWDGKEHPGYYLVDRWEWTDWWLPDPITAAVLREDKALVTVHTLRQLAARGITPIVHESWTWTSSSRYLEAAGKRLALARANTTGPVLATVKATYTGAVGKLGQLDHDPSYHLWRPDWRHMIIGATRTAIQATLVNVHERSGLTPLVVDRDTIIFAADEDTWPGDPAKESTKAGGWRFAGKAKLQEWAPTWLPQRRGRWRYADAMAEMGDER